MKICYDMICWHRSRHRQRYYDVIIYLLALIRIHPSLGVFFTTIAHGSNFPPIPAPIFVKFEQNLCQRFRDIFWDEFFMVRNRVKPGQS